MEAFLAEHRKQYLFWQYTWTARCRRHHPNRSTRTRQMYNRPSKCRTHNHEQYHTSQNATPNWLYSVTDDKWFHFEDIFLHRKIWKLLIEDKSYRVKVIAAMKQRPKCSVIATRNSSLVCSQNSSKMVWLAKSPYLGHIIGWELHGNPTIPALFKQIMKT